MSKKTTKRLQKNNSTKKQSPGRTARCALAPSLPTAQGRGAQGEELVGPVQQHGLAQQRPQPVGQQHVRGVDGAGLALLALPGLRDLLGRRPPLGRGDRPRRTLPFVMETGVWGGFDPRWCKSPTYNVTGWSGF